MNKLAQTTETVWIPPITDERLNELAEKIKPIVRMDDEPHYIEPVDLRRTAYTWDPKPADRAEGLGEICDIRTYHSYGAPVYFKPSIAEVIAAIPEEHLGEVVAFEIVESPETADDLNKELEALNAGYHVATTRLYRKN